MAGLRNRWLGVLSFGAVLAAAAPGGGLASGAAEQIEGRLTGPGVECPQFQMLDGEIISLTGDVPPDSGGYRLTGRWVRFSHCMQGRSFDVQTFVAIAIQGD